MQNPVIPDMHLATEIHGLKVALAQSMREAATV